MAVTTTNLGVITAYGDAVAAGYTGTKAEWQALMASYATVGQQAVDAKNAAVDAKNAAVQAKDTAVAAKDTATSKATEATTAANTATTKASEAAASAQNIAQSASQIAQNTSDISELKEDLTTKADLDELYKAFPTDTATGSVAFFSDGANVPVKSLVVNIDPVQSGSGDPSPTNVRPISGWSEVNVGASGKNMLENTLTTGTHNGTTFTVNDDGSITVSGAPTALTRVPIKRGLVWDGRTDAVFSSGVLPANCRIFAQRIYKGASSYPTLSLTANLTLGAKYYDFFLEVNTNFTGEAFTVYPQLELGSTPTAYEPYSGQSINIPLGQTVYGGTLDVVSGELVIDRAMVDLGTLIWTKRVSGVFYTWSLQNLVKAVSSTAQTANAKCSALKLGAYNDVYNNATLDYAISVGADSQLGAHCSAYAEAADFKSAMSGETLVYELATPITVQLAPHEVRSLLGSNNVWADTGDAEVTYRADPTLYIQRLTEPDADMVADANITSGSYFMVGNTLYKATANIASGASITPNVNCTRKSLSEALNELNA